MLGKGGAAIVWLAKHIETGEKVAIKQFPKKADTSSVRLELQIAERIFGADISPEDFPGISSITALLDEREDKHDYWLTYELGGKSLTKNLFEVKGEFHKGERIYHIYHNDFYYALKQDKSLMK